MGSHIYYFPFQDCLFFLSNIEVTTLSHRKFIDLQISTLQQNLDPCNNSSLDIFCYDKGGIKGWGMILMKFLEVPLEESLKKRIRGFKPCRP
jgi:hypothetical protein